MIQGFNSRFAQFLQSFCCNHMCAVQVGAGSLDVNLRWLLLSPRFRFGTLLQRVLWSKLSERQHGGKSKKAREREERARARENRENPSAPKYKQSAAPTRPSLPPSCLNKGISAYQTLLSTPIAFCQTVLTSHSSVLFCHSFHSVSATRGLLRDRLVISWPR